ncbi:MAG: insulinase family protein [Ignavibacteria bacterium]
MMKLRFIFALLLVSIGFSAINAQTQQITSGDYTYESVVNDPLQTRIYTLKNGLKVYLSVNKSEPRIYTYIAVSTGRKNDPTNAQGLSHYLEHMLFKGTDRFGSKNFAMEKPLIDSITSLYNIRKQTTDPDERKRLYKIIDSLSYLASEFAIPNEYDKMIANIGGSGSNAYTSFEETVYICDIPSNQLDKWLSIEAERFRSPVMRLFHTELEAVYEEKNTSLDDDGDKVFDALWAGLFKKHTYGTQTTIGSVEQLQNPSISEIQDYYNARYVPGNMAIMLAGDFDPDQAIKLIEKRFGVFEAKEFQEFEPPVEEPITAPEIQTIYGPSEESVTFGYRANGASSKDANILRVIEYILNNGTAGLIDLNLNQSQKVIDAYCYSIVLKDYSAITLGGKARQGQSLEEVKDLIMSQVELLKKGEFPDWLIPAVVKNFKVAQIRSFENNSSRVGSYVNSFILDIPWENYIFNIDTLAQVSKEDVMKYAQENLNDNYVLIYKKTGEDPNVVKVEKPPITPVKMNREDQSEFFREIAGLPSEELSPVFLDFKSEITELKTETGVPVYYLRNNENQLYDLKIIVENGARNDNKLSLASEYMNYTGAGDLPADKLSEEFYRLAASHGTAVSLERTSASLSGLSDSFEPSLKLFESTYREPTGDENSLEKLVDDMLKKREDDKLSKETILWSGLYSYAKYGKLNPFTNRITEEEMRKITFAELTGKMKKLFNYPQRIYYYGPLGEEEVLALLNQYHKTPSVPEAVPAAIEYKEKETKGREVYVVDYDMTQAEIIMLSKGEKFDNGDVPITALFNEYFGGGMGSIVFQDLRESKALAYSTFSSYSLPREKDMSNYTIAYIGTQADKLSDAMREMNLLLKKMPESQVIFDNSKNAIVKQVQTERVTGSGILGSFENAKRLGRDYDIRKDIYSKVPDYTLSDLKKFHDERFASRNYDVLVLGDINKLDMETLKKYGDVKVLTLKDVFGY